MRNWSHIPDQGNFQTSSLQGSNSSLPSSARTTNHDFSLTHTLIDSPPSSTFCSRLSSKGRAFFSAFKAAGAGGSPRNHFPAAIGNRDNGVVEGGLNVGDPVGNVSLLLTGAASFGGLLGHTSVVEYFLKIDRNRESKPMATRGYFLEGAFFLPATVRRPPRRVRALVRVR